MQDDYATVGQARTSAQTGTNSGASNGLTSSNLYAGQKIAH